MEECSDGMQLAGFTFINNFDSANIGRIEVVPKPTIASVVSNVVKKSTTVATQRETSKAKVVPPAEIPDFEFNVWTKPDCCGTQYENSCRTWFYFGVRGGPPFSLVKLNIVDLNKQGRMYRDGMAPVFRLSSSRNWERVRDKPVYNSDNNVFTISFKYRTHESPKVIIYFAFTYPFSYSDAQTHLAGIDLRLKKLDNVVPKADMRFTKGLKITVEPEDEIYYYRELLCNTIEGRRVDLITISSRHGMQTEREPRLMNLFPDEETLRCFRFKDKKVVFFSARVHPGETPSSFVLNGLLQMLTSRDDPIALLLRRMFVFKLIPMLNPDGVAHGHYRTDVRGVNLNRFYLQPDLQLHPAIYAARALIRYYHFGEDIYDDALYPGSEPQTQSEDLSTPDLMTSSMETLPMQDLSIKSSHSSLSSDCASFSKAEPMQRASVEDCENLRTCESGLFLYMDIHGHASKKGIFMYGNHFKRTEDMVECMLFPKIIALNSQNFHFSSCNFSERNMYLKDKRDGASREGCGRVAVLRLTGTVRSYTLECNYNTGRIVNTLPACARELPGRPNTNLLSPPKYTPAVYEEVGRAVCVSLLDMCNANPWSRIQNSDYHTLAGIRDWLRLKTISENVPLTSGAGSKIRRSSQGPSLMRPPKSVHKQVTVRKHDGTKGGKKDNLLAGSSASETVRRVSRSNSVRKIVKSMRPVDKQVKPTKTAEDTEPSSIASDSVVSKMTCGSSAGKLSPKRLKTCVGEGLSSRLASTSSDPCLSVAKKQLKAVRSHSSPVKFKKSLEKRRNSDRKTKTLYKKASKLALSTGELSKNDRKRRNPLN